jgi:hypothetical protein
MLHVMPGPLHLRRVDAFTSAAALSSESMADMLTSVHGRLLNAMSCAPAGRRTIWQHEADLCTPRSTTCIHAQSGKQCQNGQLSIR